jgi:hypothetical protein
MSVTLFGQNRQKCDFIRTPFEVPKSVLNRVNARKCSVILPWLMSEKRKLYLSLVSTSLCPTFANAHFVHQSASNTYIVQTEVL